MIFVLFICVFVVVVFLIWPPASAWLSPGLMVSEREKKKQKLKNKACISTMFVIINGLYKRGGCYNV